MRTIQSRCALCQSYEVAIQWNFTCPSIFLWLFNVWFLTNAFLFPMRAGYSLVLEAGRIISGKDRFGSVFLPKTSVSVISVCMRSMFIVFFLLHRKICFCQTGSCFDDILYFTLTIKTACKRSGCRESSVRWCSECSEGVRWKFFLSSITVHHIWQLFLQQAFCFIFSPGFTSWLVPAAKDFTDPSSSYVKISYFC